MNEIIITTALFSMIYYNSFAQLLFEVMIGGIFFRKAGKKLNNST